MTRKSKIKNSYSFYETYNSYKEQIKQKLKGMRVRCENVTDPAYKYWGAKGIEVCSLWKNHPEVFICWCLENDYFPGKEIHRLNSHRNYEPDNCVLCTKEEHIRYHQLLAKSRKALEIEPKITNLDEKYNYEEQRYYTETTLKTIRTVKSLSEEQKEFLLNNLKK